MLSAAQAVVWNGVRVVNNELEIMWEEVVVENLQAPHRNLSAYTDEDNEKYWSGQLVSRFEPGTSRIGSRRLPC